MWRQSRGLSGYHKSMKVTQQVKGSKKANLCCFMWGNHKWCLHNLRTEYAEYTVPFASFRLTCYFLLRPRIVMTVAPWRKGIFSDRKNSHYISVSGWTCPSRHVSRFELKSHRCLVSTVSVLLSCLQKVWSRSTALCWHWVLCGDVWRQTWNDINHWLVNFQVIVESYLLAAIWYHTSIPTLNQTTISLPREFYEQKGRAFTILPWCCAQIEEFRQWTSTFNTFLDTLHLMLLKGGGHIMDFWH